MSAPWTISWTPRSFMCLAVLAISHCKFQISLLIALRRTSARTSASFKSSQANEKSPGLSSSSNGKIDQRLSPFLVSCIGWNKDRLVRNAARSLRYFNRLFERLHFQQLINDRSSLDRWWLMRQKEFNPFHLQPSSVPAIQANHPINLPRESNRNN